MDSVGDMMGDAMMRHPLVWRWLSVCAVVGVLAGLCACGRRPAKKSPSAKVPAPPTETQPATDAPSRPASATRPATQTQPVDAQSPVKQLLDDDREADREPSLAEIQFQSLFKEHCARCHETAIQSDYFTDKQWRKFLPRHAKKTKVDAAAAVRILTWYVEHN